MPIEKLFNPPYYAVIFTSVRNTKEADDYELTADRMVELAAQQSGFLGIDSARQEIGITISYWKDLDSIRKWKKHAEHQVAQEKGKNQWYKSYRVRICKVESEYGLR